MKALIVSVNFADMLAVTLPRNIRHFERVKVVTAVGDFDTMSLVLRMEADGLPVSYSATDAFTRRPGDLLNKGAALEECWDFLGRDGWQCVLDADVVLPPDFGLPPDADQSRNTLYSPFRRVLKEPSLWPLFDDPATWGTLPHGWENKTGEFAGYCQIFHADAACLRNDDGTPRLPWYGVGWKYANGCDSEFWWKFRDNPACLLVRPMWEVLHLGPLRVNWKGRKTPKIQGVKNWQP